MATISFFCSISDPTWRLVLEAEEDTNLFRRSVVVTKRKLTSRWDEVHENYSCSDDIPLDTSCNSACVFEKVLASLSEENLIGLEERPRGIGFGRNNYGQLVWDGVFNYRGEDIVLYFVFDAEKGEVVSVEPYRIKGE
jgi:hypothetical protein